MSEHGKVTAVFSVLLALCLAGSAFESQILESLRPAASLEETLYISSPQALKRISMGYGGLLADIYWTRAVQYFGRKHLMHARRYDLLKPLLDITTGLDPHLVIAYRFGAFFLAQKPPSGAGQPEQAIDLVRRGMEANPREWQLYTDMAFIYYFELNDYVAAARALEAGSKIPGAHPFMKTTAASLAQRGGDQQTARILWMNVLETTDDDMMRDNAVKHLRALEVDDVVPKLEAIVQAYGARAGHLPQSFREMAEAGFLRGIPLDPMGHPYKLMPDGRVEVADHDALPFISKGLPPGQVPSIFDFSGVASKHQDTKDK
jgi:hypothetical protein